MASYWSYDWLILRSEWKWRGAGASTLISFTFFFFFCVCVCFLFLFCLLKKKCIVLSCFITFIFNSFVISYWIYFVVTEKKKKMVSEVTVGWKVIVQELIIGFWTVIVHLPTFGMVSTKKVCRSGQMFFTHY